MNSHILSLEPKYPAFSFTGHQHEYILITSLNLGGAEKIVTDQLWANSWNDHQIKYTLIVLYDKEKEHAVPDGVNVVRLHSSLENGATLFSQIAQENKTLVAHLINDKVLEYLFGFNVRVNLVLHNDQQGWVNKPHIFNHPNIGAIISVCHYVERQIRQYTDKPIINVRHQINYRSSLYKEDKRLFYRELFKINEQDKVIGMLGRIAWQKNYGKAIEILNNLVQKDPTWKLMIIGGFEPSQQDQYFYLLQLLQYYKLQNNVIFTGFRNDAKEIINCFDIALNTSHFEGLSMATQELIGNGLKVFCANVCGQEEIIDSKKQIVFYSVSKSPKEVAKIIIQNTEKVISREVFEEEELQDVSKRVWASHRVWNLLQYGGQELEENNNFAFLTSNFNLGGAQKSLVNISKEFNKNGIHVPVIVANKSNYLNFIQELTSEGIEVFLAHKSRDVFDITSSILNYLKENNISKILLWNVDSKLRLLLTKIGCGWLKVIDVSPGHYCFEEMLLDRSFMEGIYFDEKEYHKNIFKLVFKYKVDAEKNPFYDIVKDKTYYIPNGVNITTNQISINDSKIIQYIKSFSKDNPSSYNFIVCGRISPSKHIDKIFEAFKSISKGANVNLFVVGSVEPEYFEYYQKLQNIFGDLFDKKIFFLGTCDESQNIFPYFDAVVVIGTHQGCPNIVLEAMASNIGVIANDSGGTRELINENTGILISENPTIEEIKDAMNEIIKGNTEKSEKAYQLIKEYFSMYQMYKNYLNLVNN